ncbi:MAG: hypothetical protein AAF236_15940 [Verrucomicrobiota bacterium]
MTTFRYPMHAGALMVLLAVVLVSAVEAQDVSISHNYRKHEDSSFRIDSVYGIAFNQGTVPLNLTIRNNTGKPRTWIVTLREDAGYQLSTRTSFRLEVEEGAEVKREILMPLSPDFASSTYRSISISAIAAGLEPIDRSVSTGTNSDFPMIALSKRLAQRSLSRLDEEVENRSSSNERFGMPFEPADLSENWIAYTALDFLMLDLASWKELSIAQRQAIVEWVRLGGQLEVYAENRNTTLESLDLASLTALTSEDLKKRNHGLGRIEIRYWNGSELGNDVINLYSKRRARSERLASDFENNWKLAEEFGIAKFNPTFVFLLLLAFAILVAPVNLFYFAKAGKRHRLFVTTPIISLSACLLILLFILVKDGIGGKGIRATFADLQAHPDEMRLYSLQEQFSRTGVMLDPGFESEAPIDLQPVQRPSGRFNSLSGSERNVYQVQGVTYAGDFFRSRSEQGFVARQSRPTRARIDFSPSEDGTEPVLTSNFGEALGDFFFRDHAGKVWRSLPNTQTAPGARISLESAKVEDLKDWLKGQTELFSGSHGRKIKSLANQNGRFFTLLERGEGVVIETHRSVKWDDHVILLSGELPQTRGSSDSPPRDSGEVSPPAVEPAPPAPAENE